MLFFLLTHPRASATRTGLRSVGVASCRPVLIFVGNVFEGNQGIAAVVRSLRTPEPPQVGGIHQEDIYIYVSEPKKPANNAELLLLGS